MATFTTFSDLLPDPDNKINDAGVVDNTTGNAGPGFASVRFTSVNYDVQKSRTRSGRGVAASPTSHSWQFDITYNPLTREEFEPVASFLESRQGGLFPFFVILPQYNRPRDDTFNTYVQSNNTTVNADHLAGSPYVTFTGAGGPGVVGNPRPGDFFYIVDVEDVNHTKAYKIIRVETPDYYQTGLPVSAGTRRVWTQPPLVRDISSGSAIRFTDVKFRVQQKADVLEYDLQTEGLYQFSLSLEEIQP